MVRSGTWIAAPCLAVSLAMMVGACATKSNPRPDDSGSTAAQDRSNTMVLGEQEGLGIMGAKTPPALKTIAAAPYALPTPADCGAMGNAIVALDTLLGPDVDVLADPKIRASLEYQTGRALGSAMRGAFPYRWALRWVTGAGRLDRELRQAVLAGTARRGFLKGMGLAMGCPPPLQSVAR